MTTLSSDQPTMPLPPPVAARSRRSAKVVVPFIALGFLGSGAAGFLVGHSTASTRSTSASASATTAASKVLGTSVANPNADLLTKALALHGAGKLDEAIAIYQTILTTDAKNKFALYNLGLIAQTREQYDEAIVRYTAALAVDPTYAPALYNGGLAYASKGDRKNAIALLQKAVALDPKNAAALFNLGTVLVADGQTDAGTTYLTQAFALDPTLKPKT